MRNTTVFISRVLFIALVFSVSSTPAAEVTVTSPQSGNAFTRALLPGFTRPSLQGQAPAIAATQRGSDPRFSLAPVGKDTIGTGVIADPPVVDNLLRFRF